VKKIGRGNLFYAAACASLFVAVLVLPGTTLRAQESEEDVIFEEPVESLSAPADARVAADVQPSLPAAQPVKVKTLSECKDIPGLGQSFVYNTEESQMDVVKFLTVFGKLANLNLVISPQVKGSVRLMLEGVTYADAFEIALSQNNLAYEIKGSGPRAIINIMTDDEYRNMKGVSFYEQRQVRIVELKYAKPSRVVTMLEGVRSQIGKLIFDDATGTIILIDTPVKIEEMQTVIAKAELPTIDRQIPTITKNFKIQYADVSEVEKAVAGHLTREVGSVSANAKAKSIVVTDLEHNMEKIGELIAAFDCKPRQVMIEAKVVEVELSDDFSMGVNWQHVLEGVGPRFTLESKMPLSGPAGPSLSYKTIAGGGDLTVVLDALKTVGNTTVISKPHIACRDGEEATLKVVRNQAYKEVTYESGSTNITQVSYKFIEIGTILNVAPTINDEGFVTVKIKPTMSDLVDWYDATRGNEGIVGVPIVKKAEAETSVTVKDGVTIIIGGMIKDEKKNNRIGVPILSSIPLLGRLFSSNVEKASKIETIVFLTPRIVTGEEQFLQMETKGTVEKATGAGQTVAGNGKKIKPLRK